MELKPDPRAVLEALAGSLDAEAVLEQFPGLDRRSLGRIIQDAASRLPAASHEGGRLTAALASQISDGASAVLVASEAAVRDHALTPRARVHHLSVLADDPIMMLSAPIPATRRARGRRLPAASPTARAT